MDFLPRDGWQDPPVTATIHGWVPHPWNMLPHPWMGIIPGSRATRPTLLHPRAYQWKGNHRCLGSKRENPSRWFYESSYHWRFQETSVPTWARPLKTRQVGLEREQEMSNIDLRQGKSKRSYRWSDHIGATQRGQNSQQRPHQWSDRIGATQRGQHGQLRPYWWSNRIGATQRCATYHQQHD